MKLSGGDPVENGCFQRVKLANVGGFSGFFWGDVDDYMKFSGGDLVENGCFQRVKLANVGGFSDFLMGRQLGGDASENGDFQRGKRRLQGYKFFSRGSHWIFSTQRIPRWADFIFLMKNRGDDATENVNFQRRKQRLQGPKNFKLNFDEFFDER